MRALLAALLLLASPAAAAAMTEALDACLAAAPDRTAEEACIGAPSAACLDGNQTTVGMTGCLREEEAAWDARLNALWPELRARAAAQDQAEEPASGLLPRSQTLLAAQRAWLAFRDAECAWRAARWGAGSMRQVAGAACLRDQTAARVLDLREALRSPP